MNENMLLAFSLGFALGNWKPKPKPGFTQGQLVNPFEQYKAAKVKPPVIVDPVRKTITPVTTLIDPKRKTVTPLTRPVMQTAPTVRLAPMKTRLTTLRDCYGY